MIIDFKTKFMNTSDYPKENWKYYSSGGPKNRLTNLLVSKCKGYCMYCGKKVVIESDYRFQIEHAVDKDGNRYQELDSSSALMHCKYNLAISCSECNQVCKKSVDKLNLMKYGVIPACNNTCEDLCDNYRSMREDYERKNAIILQPIGSSKLEKDAIVYSLFDHLYEPNDSITDYDAIFLVQNHIDRFRLNGERFSTTVIDICVRVVQYIESGVDDLSNILSLLEGENFDNIIGEDYIRFLKDTFFNSNAGELKEFCKLLIILDAVV